MSEIEQPTGQENSQKASTLPPVYFVWHPQMNEERAESGVLPSERFRETYHLLEVTGALHWREVKTQVPDLNLGRPEVLASYHSLDYCRTVLAVSEGRATLWSGEPHGFVPTLTAAAINAVINVAAARSAVKIAMSHPAARILTPAGQQPHARRDRVANGHLFNDVLLALTEAQTSGKRIAFINLDAEHPHQIQERFYSEPLLTVSLHEHPSFLYPHSGTVRETGKDFGGGYNVNLPMPPGAGDSAYALVMEQFVLPLLKHYQPDLVVLLGGVTAHVSDPSSHLRLSSRGFQALLRSFMESSPRFVHFGGDAANFATAARLSALALATLADRTNSLPPQIPAAHARLWAGGTFHDAEPPARSAPYQEYGYALLANEMMQAHALLGAQWELPALDLPGRFSDQRDRHGTGQATIGITTGNDEKEAAFGLTFAGLSKSLGDDTEKERAGTTHSRRDPRSVPRDATTQPPSSDRAGRGRGTKGSEIRRGDAAAGESDPEKRASRASHSAVLPRAQNNAESGESDHSPAPRRTPDKRDASQPPKLPIRRRERRDDSKPPSRAKDGNTSEGSESHPSRRRGPRRRR